MTKQNIYNIILEKNMLSVWQLEKNNWKAFGDGSAIYKDKNDSYSENYVLRIKLL